MAQDGMEALLSKLPTEKRRKTVLKRKSVKDGMPSRGPGAPRKKREEDKPSMTLIIGVGGPPKHGPKFGGARGSQTEGDRILNKDDQIARLEERIARLEAALADARGENEDMDEDMGEYEDEYEDED